MTSMARYWIHAFFSTSATSGVYETRVTGKCSVAVRLKRGRMVLSVLLSRGVGAARDQTASPRRVVLTLRRVYLRISTPGTRSRALRRSGSSSGSSAYRCRYPPTTCRREVRRWEGETWVGGCTDVR